MKHWYCLLLLLGLHRPAAAQVPATLSETDRYGRLELTRYDTAHAVHALFEQRRVGGIGWTLAGGALSAITVIGAINYGSNDPIAVVVTGGAGAGMLALGISKLHRYSELREQQVLSAYARTGLLARKYRRRLHGNFQPISGTPTWPIPLLPELADSQLPAAPAAATPGASAASKALPLTNTYSRQDTLDAVLGLFVAKRTAGQLPALGIMPAARLLVGTKQAPNSSSVITRTEPDPTQVAGGLLLMAGVTTYMFIHNAPYTKAKYNALAGQYTAGGTLPPAIRAQLREKHFAQGRNYRERLERQQARRR